MQDYKNIEPIFIGGCPRSGTTMTGVQISGHPRCFTTPESHFVYQLMQLKMKNGSVLWSEFVAIVERHTFFATWEIEPDWGEYAQPYDLIDLADGIRWLVWQYRQDKYPSETQVSVWIDHTPENALHSHALLSLFPKAQFIHLKRDGRACFASVKKLNWGPNSPTMAANWWLKYVGMGDATLSHFPERSLEVKYEEFVRAYPESFETLLDKIGLSLSSECQLGTDHSLPDDLLDYQHTLVSKAPDASRLESWRESLKNMEIVRFEATASNLLKLNDYVPIAPYEPETPFASIGCYLWEFFVLPFRLISFGFVWRKYIAKTYLRGFRKEPLREKESN